MYVFNTCCVAGREYTTADLKRVVPVSQYGLDDSFYGGRVKWIGETDSDVLLIMTNNDGYEVIDTGAMSLENIHIKHIRDLAKGRKLPHDAKVTKEYLLAALSSKPGEPLPEMYNKREPKAM